MTFHTFISNVNCPSLKKLRKVQEIPDYSFLKQVTACMHTTLLLTFSCCFSPSELRKYFHKHHYFQSKGLPPVLLLSCFQAILSSLPSSLQSQIPHGPGVCHISSITQTISKGSQLHPPKLQLCLEPTTVLRLASRSSKGSLHVSALPPRGVLPHSSPSTNTVQGRTGQMGLHPDSSEAELPISSSTGLFHNSSRKREKSAQTKPS